ncbi:MAG: dynamin family protein [Moraxellaceae bacterium]|nr:dynamin family protein [Moraxellaceae bacterium]
MKNYPAIIQQLEPVVNQLDSEIWGELRQLVESLEANLAAAREEGRNLRIAVVGQMKAGKSSFLNAAFFGHDLLPKADTPMTAALTKIAYASEPRAEVVFYTKDDWSSIVSKAKEYEQRYQQIKQELMAEGNSPFASKSMAMREPSHQSIEAKIGMDMRASKELVDKAHERGLNLSECLGQTRQLQGVGNADLAKALHEYVGSGGRYTAITKMTELYVNKEELQGLEIYDTPGFNDPVVSRGQQTRNFLGQCDVVFLLSALGQFCGKADLTLLRDQVRDAGIDAKAVILVGSQRDLALRQSSDVVKTGREMAAKIPAEKRAAGTVAAMLFVLTNKMNEHIKNTLQDILRQPSMDESSRKVLSSLQKRDPLYISAWSWMIAENFEQISADDSEQLQALCQLTGFDFDPDSLRQLSNIPAVREVVLAQRHIKDELTKGKEQMLLDGAAQGVNARLNKLLTTLKNRTDQINNGDITQLQSLQKDTQQRLLQGRGKLEAVFDTCVYKIQSDFALLKTDVRAKALECKVESKEILTPRTMKFLLPNGITHFHGVVQSPVLEQ